MKKTVYVLLFILLVFLLVFIFINKMSVSKDTSDNITTTTIASEETTTKEVITSFNGMEISDIENKVRNYYANKYNNEGIIVYSDIVKKELNVYITLNDKVLDIYKLKENAREYINLSGDKIEIQ